MKKLGALVASLIVLAALGLWVFGTDRKSPSSDADSDTTYTAPQLVSPPDGLVFVDSDLTLAWEWPPGLADHQVFAVQLWVGDEPPREVWTGETRLEAAELIDSYSREVGDFHWQVAVIAFSDDGGFEGMISAWSTTQTLTRVRRISPTPYPPEQQSDFTRLISAQNLSSATEIIDFTRHFIYDHVTPGDQIGYEADYRDAMQLIYDHAQGSGARPTMWCDGASTAMLTTLEELGIESRIIYLYGEGVSQIDEHTILEVFNPDTQQWEAYDVINDNHFVDVESGVRLSIEHLVFAPMDRFTGCDGAGDCGDEHMQYIGRYLQAFRYGHSDTFWVNPDRFDVTRRFVDNDNRNLAEYLTGNPREFRFIFDSWDER